VSPLDFGVLEEVLEVLSRLRKIVAIVEQVLDLDGSVVKDAWECFETEVHEAWGRFWRSLRSGVA